MRTIQPFVAKTIQILVVGCYLTLSVGFLCYGVGPRLPALCSAAVPVSPSVTVTPTRWGSTWTTSNRGRSLNDGMLVQHSVAGCSLFGCECSCSIPNIGCNDFWLIFNDQLYCNHHDAPSRLSCFPSVRLLKYTLPVTAWGSCFSIWISQYIDHWSARVFQSKQPENCLSNSENG